jgi:adenine-specific DNA-methyltransferase
MNYRRREIEEFIEKHLIQAVEKEFQEYRKVSVKELEEKVEEKRKEIEGLEKSLGEKILNNGEINEKFKEKPFAKDYLELKKQLEDAQATESIKNQVFNDLYNFFSRYYEDGDFISKRRYSFKQERYAIPYNGEEIKLYWATADQYYVKTDELFKDYEFTAKGWRIVFRVVVPEPSAGNTKEERRYFVLAGERPVELDSKQKVCIIRFEYRQLTEEDLDAYGLASSGARRVIKQDELNAAVRDRLLKEIRDQQLTSILTEKEGEKTLLDKHILRFTRKNTTDFFIHKNLKCFLERELDYFIKTEVLDLNNLDARHIARAKVIEAIGKRIIEFLAQIEDFQKMLWEKKKFVLRTDYVITLGKIEQYAGGLFLQRILPEVCSNKEQLAEWSELFGVKVRSQSDLTKLDNWRNLPIDTRYFPESFKDRLLEALSKDHDLDEIIDGILVKSENWQALNLFLEKYKGKVKTTYIDPPYNTGSDEFLYRDRYQHSSWLSMMENRLNLAKELLSEDGVIFVSIDDNELKNLMSLGLLSGYSFIVNFVRKSGIAPRQDVKFVAVEHDYVLCLAKDIEKVRINKKPAPLDDKRYPYYDEFVSYRGRFTLNKLDRGSIHYSKNLDYPIIVKKGETIETIDPQTGKTMSIKAPENIEVWPGGSPKDERWTWRWSKEKLDWGLKNRMIVFRKVNGRWSVYFKQYQYVDNNLNPISREIPYRSLLLDFTNEIANKEISQLFGDVVFSSYPKPVPLIQTLIKIGSDENSVILDFFAGSGTVAHAVMKLNHEDGGKRKFILVEMANYFDTVIIPRVKRVAYSFSWKNGQPLKVDGAGVFLKYHYLEQYEDSLHNIDLVNEEKGKKALEAFRDTEKEYEYLMRYFLRYETDGSPSLLNIEYFRNPFEYQLKIISNGKGEEVVTVDLVETFNYLIGLYVSKYKFVNDNGRRYVFVLGRRGGRKVAVVWRSTDNIDLEKDKGVIENVIKDYSPDEIYINGDALVDSYRVIESEFKALMGV